MELFSTLKSIYSIGTEYFLRKEVNEIIDAYELSYCRNTSEFREKFKKLSPIEKSKFYKVYWWIEEYLAAWDRGENYTPPFSPYTFIGL